jgi:hypothetical protein
MLKVVVESIQNPFGRTVVTWARPEEIRMDFFTNELCVKMQIEA